MASPTDDILLPHLEISTDGDPKKPLVLLLHGLNGTLDDMTNPAARGVHYNVHAPLQPDRDLGWSWYPHVGPHSFVCDAWKEVKSWRQFLHEHHYRTVAYAQIDPDGLLARPVQELKLVVAHLRERFPTTQLVLLAHSRGGLLVRKFLKEHATDTHLVGAIAAVITLHSPHQGSTLANIAGTLNSVLTRWATINPLMGFALAWLRDIVNTPAYQELRRGGTFISTLEAGERPLPGITYATFGGTSVQLTRLFGWWYTLESALPQWQQPPFHLVISQAEIDALSPVVHGMFCSQQLDDIPELRDGTGDLLTTDDGARLPFAVHRSNPLNHGEALWDPSLQEQVLALLTALPAPSLPTTSLPVQHDWRWCHKCGGLFWAGGGMPAGSCPAGGTHTQGANSNYGLILGVSTAPGQHDWRWCHKCGGLFWAGGGATAGLCPTGGPHVRGTSADYALVMQ